MGADSHASRGQTSPEASMGSGTNQIKWYDRECGENSLNVGLAARPTYPRVSSMHAVQELGSRDDGQCQLELPMLLCQRLNVQQTTFGCDEHAGIDYGSHGDPGIVA